MSNCKDMDSVFSTDTEEVLDMDAIFDDDDWCCDLVEGFKENGDPVIGAEFDVLHQTADDADVKDLRDELGPDHDVDMGAKEAEGTNELDLDKDQEIKELDKNGESDADKFYEEKKLSEEVEEFDVDAELDPNGYPSDLPSEDPQPVVDPVDPIESAEGATDVEVEVNDDEEEEDIDAVLDGDEPEVHVDDTSDDIADDEVIECAFGL